MRKNVFALLICVATVALLAACGAQKISSAPENTAGHSVPPTQEPEVTATQIPVPTWEVTPSPEVTSTPAPTPTPTSKVTPTSAPTSTPSGHGGTSLGGQTGQGGNSSVGQVKPTPTPEPKSPSGRPYSYYNTVQPTYIKGVLLVNKTYALPSSYGGYNAAANAALQQLQAGARSAGFSMPLLSGYRSFDLQDRLFRKYAAEDGVAAANTYSAWPGHSEHQTGLAFDVGSISDNYGNTAAGKWLAANAHKYGFIIRYPKGKESITGYKYEPWHVRYLGVETATAVYQSGLCLEEYLFQPTPTPTPTPEVTPTPETSSQSSEPGVEGEILP